MTDPAPAAATPTADAKADEKVAPTANGASSPAPVASTETRGSVAARPASGSTSATANGATPANDEKKPDSAPAATTENRATSGSVTGALVSAVAASEPARAPTVAGTSGGSATSAVSEPRPTSASVANGPAAPTESAAAAPASKSSPAPATGAMADREAKKNNLAGGDKQISVPRPIEDVKKELEQGSVRCSEAWYGKIDELNKLKPEESSVRYMGFVVDGDVKSALFYVEGGKKESTNASDKPYRLLRLSDLADDPKEAVTLMYLSSPIVYAAAAGKQNVVSVLIDRFGLDYTAEQSVYTAQFDDATKKWVVDNSQARKVSANTVGVGNGFEEVAHGGCRMCASGDCTIM